MGFPEAKQWSDQFILEVKSLLGMYLISTAALEDDRERATDLIVLSLGAMRIAVRIRDFDKYYKSYGNQFTIRSRGRGGAKTELQKIVDDEWGDYFFYGFADDEIGLIKCWTICRLDVFRNCYHPRTLPGIERENAGYDTCFKAFYWKWFPPEFVIAQEIGEADRFSVPPIKPVTEPQMTDAERINRELKAASDTWMKTDRPTAFRGANRQQPFSF